MRRWPRLSAISAPALSTAPRWPGIWEKESQQFLTVADTSQDAVITTDQRGHIVYVNPAAELLFERPAEELVGESVSTLIPARYADAHRSAFTEAASARSLSRATPTVEVVGFRKNGGEVALKLSLSTATVLGETFFTGVIRETSTPEPVARDEVENREGAEQEALELTRLLEALNSEQNKTAAALANSELKYRTLVERSHVIPWTLDLADGRFTYMGHQIKEVLGYPTESWTDLAVWAERVHPDDREQAVRYREECTEKGEDHDFWYRAIAADGRTVWIRDIVTVVKGADGPEELIGFPD